jgi:DNA-binding response OmpR family regulator
MNDLEGAEILIIEDEPNLGKTLLAAFQDKGSRPAWVTTAQSAWERLNIKPIDLILLDVNLPDGNGFDLALQIQKNNRAIPIIFLTAMSSPEDRIRGLEMGAEDYIVKPFHLKELLLRVSKLLKRTRQTIQRPVEVASDGSVKIGESKIYFDQFKAERGEQTIWLTHKETALLRLLFEKRGKVVSRDEILSHVWSEDEFPTTRTIDNFIVRLRKLVEYQPDQPQLIRSVRGVGYQLEMIS